MEIIFKEQQKLLNSLCTFFDYVSCITSFTGRPLLLTAAKVDLQLLLYTVPHIRIHKVLHSSAKRAMMDGRAQYPSNEVLVLLSHKF